ncbi:Glyoxalase/Bleomycin resistance protein/Dihydroxybiphenyl dioxygenase [Camillea tinctor]|nr:Glyoxalase/Bleomycin resistance protein/Dihydroxybiphenyl dioxygenase [Camillea tinctor]
MPISHISLATGPARFAAMRDFYLAALAPLGYITYYESAGSMLGLRPAGGPPDFWLHAGNGEQPDFAIPEGGKVDDRPGRAHVAFEVQEQGLVDRWHEAAVKAGGICNGKPGRRPQFSETYYAAFVLDPLGNNIEAYYYAKKGWN